MLTIENITYRIAGRPLFENASARIPDGWKVGLVGRNGTGKSTLLALIAGELQESSKKLISRIVAEQDAIAESEGKEDQ